MKQDVASKGWERVSKSTNILECIHRRLLGLGQPGLLDQQADQQADTDRVRWWVHRCPLRKF